jgi:hypothetical protein
MFEIMNEIQRINMLVNMTYDGVIDNDNQDNNNGIKNGDNDGKNDNDDNDYDGNGNNNNNGIYKYCNKSINNDEDMIINDNYNYDIMFRGWTEEHCDRLRALLETILISDSKYSIIWILYIHLECYIKNYGNSKKLFFRAVNVLGYCKPLWVLLYGPLRNIFTINELNNLKIIIEEEKNIYMRII